MKSVEISFHILCPKLTSSTQLHCTLLLNSMDATSLVMQNESLWQILGEKKKRLRLCSKLHTSILLVLNFRLINIEM